MDKFTCRKHLIYETEFWGLQTSNPHAGWTPTNVGLGTPLHLYGLTKSLSRSTIGGKEPEVGFVRPVIVFGLIKFYLKLDNLG